MKETIRHNIQTPYSLHDMSISSIEVRENDMILRTQSGIVKATPPYCQTDGYVFFSDVQWDFSYVYLLAFSGNIGSFSGEKMFLRDFIAQYPTPHFTVMDETYGYNATRYSGYLTIHGTHHECILEICHEGDMTFIDEHAFDGMKEVILSHDSEAKVYLVPAEVAYDLDAYCMDFAANWVWHGPDNARYLHKFPNGQIVACFGAQDFIDHLNRWIFPWQPSIWLKDLGCYDYEIPEEYQNYPKYNF